MALGLLAVFIALLTVLCIFFTTRVVNRAAARRRGCDLPTQRRVGDPIFAIRRRLQDSDSTKKFRTLPDSALLHQQYGKTFCESTLFSTTFKTSSAENIQAVYGPKAKDFGVQPFRLAGMRPFCGEGLLTTDGPVWERSRSLVKPIFRKSVVSNFGPFKKSVENLIARIPNDGSTIDLQPLVSLMFVDTSSQFLLGHPLGVLEKSGLASSPLDGMSFLKAWQLSLRSCSIRNSLGLLRFLTSKSASTEQWQKIHDLIDFHITQRLDERLAKPDERQPSLLDHLIDQTRDTLEIRNQIIQGMMAAQDTTSILISNTIFLLSRHPVIWRRLREEQASVDLEFFNSESAKRPGLLLNVLHESLRLFPVFPILARVALKDTVLPLGGGIHADMPVYIPSGATVIANFYALHRDQDVFGDNVETFDPDRWDSIQPGSWEYMAFGGGQRACLGQHKALGEASYTIIRLLHRFAHLESRDDRAWSGDQKITAKNVHGCKVALK